MVKRKLWTDKIEKSWKQAPIAWLTGVRRVGKTTLSKSFPAALYLNCDLPGVQRVLEDPESFYKSVSEPIIIFDEIHQTRNPSQILKIGADEFPGKKILATGSSTLSAVRKFRDSLTGRKRSIHLSPVLLRECESFGVRDLRVRFLRGGLPQVLLSAEENTEFFVEWLDSFYARDIQELFKVEKRHGFLLLLELLLRQSGGMLEISSISKKAGLSRPTVMNYIDILQITHAVHLLRPFHKGGRQEILHQPKAYGFDTGFICHCRGWNEIREEDCGKLWEHLVLDELLHRFPGGRVFYWRDKQKREVDFVIPAAPNEVNAVECKWNPDHFEPRNLKAFRSRYEKGKNYVICPNIERAYSKTISGMEVNFCGYSGIDSFGE